METRVLQSEATPGWTDIMLRVLVILMSQYCVFPIHSVLAKLLTILTLIEPYIAYTASNRV